MCVQKFVGIGVGLDQMRGMKNRGLRNQDSTEHYVWPFTHLLYVLAHVNVKNEQKVSHYMLNYIVII